MARVSAPAPNSPPELVPLTELLGIAGVSLEFSASATDPDGDELTYTWGFGDSSPLAVGNPVDHTYSLVGKYTFTVYVDDSHGNNITSSATAWAAMVANFYQGWNLFSLPLLGWDCNASTLGLDRGDVVAYYDYDSQSFRSYTVGVSPPFRDFPIVPGNGYFVYSGTTKMLDLYGYSPTERVIVNITVPVGGGWIVMGFLGLNAHKASSVPGMYDPPGGVSAVARYEQPMHVYLTWVVGSPPFKDFTIQPWEACWIWFNTSGVLSYDP